MAQEVNHRDLKLHLRRDSLPCTLVHAAMAPKTAMKAIKRDASWAAERAVKQARASVVSAYQSQKKEVEGLMKAQPTCIPILRKLGQDLGYLPPLGQAVGIEGQEQLRLHDAQKVEAEQHERVADDPFDSIEDEKKKRKPTSPQRRSLKRYLSMAE